MKHTKIIKESLLVLVLFLQSCSFSSISTLFSSTNKSKTQGTESQLQSKINKIYSKAQQGDALAQFDLGDCYYYGDGVAKDLSQAVYWYREAAEQGLVVAEFNLGSCYEFGNGVSKDLNQAAFWYRKAAEQGLTSAQIKLDKLSADIKQPPKIKNNKQTKSFTKDGHEYVDLGLPSGTLWATMNVGASKPEEFGDYYAWGETKPKKKYNWWGTYEWCSVFKYYNKLTKYCTKSDYGRVDNKTELDLVDDAAYVNWGPSWRMPSKAQQDELREECKGIWTKRNGVNGYLITSKRNGASLFLPAAGIRDDDNLNCINNDYGGYWSRTLNIECAWLAYFMYIYWDDVFQINGWGCSKHDRHWGRSVRAVCVSR